MAGRARAGGGADPPGEGGYGQADLAVGQSRRVDRSGQWRVRGSLPVDRAGLRAAGVVAILPVHPPAHASVGLESDLGGVRALFLALALERSPTGAGAVSYTH